MPRGPNDLAQITLTQFMDGEGEWRWRVTTWVSGRVDPMRAVQSLKHGVTLTLEQVLAGELPLPGNGEHEALEISAR